MQVQEWFTDQLGYHYSEADQRLRKASECVTSEAANEHLRFVEHHQKQVELLLAIEERGQARRGGSAR